ncbi:hypothetical protein BGW39_009480 [Mortierella sp. 14UC]|nr:hypothetical protein BGW39_009480 [Mortierella sp. 14UC]
MAILRNPFSKTQRVATATATTRPLATPSPFNLPEVLQLIFSYLNDATIRRTAILVCQQWLHLNQGRILRKAICRRDWTSSRPEVVASSLVGAAAVHFCLSVNTPHDQDVITRANTVKKVLTLTQEEHQRQAERKQHQHGALVSTQKQTITTTTLYKFSPLQDLHLDITTTYDILAIDTLLPPNNTLTSLVLTLRPIKNRSTITASLSNILQSCPRLATFETYGSQTLDLTWTPFNDQQQPLLLRTLVLDSTTFMPADLENLLTFTPRLKVLKLISMPTIYYKEYDWTQFLVFLRSLPSDLDTVFVSTKYQQSSSQAQQQLQDSWPVLSGWNLWPLDVTPTRLKELELYTTNRLTTLDLLSRSSSPAAHYCKDELTSAPSTLHHVHSTSDMLVHLKTLKTVVDRLEDFDIHQRGGYDCLLDWDWKEYGAYRTRDFQSASTSAAVWRCRGLRTLHLEVHAHGEQTVSQPVHSRIIFGYIARVFPLLEELRVGTPWNCLSQNLSQPHWPTLSFDLEGGMCFLSRLKHLQRLEVTRGNLSGRSRGINKVDVNWLAPSGYSDKYRTSRRKMMKSKLWKKERTREDIMETFQEQEVQHQQQQHQEQELMVSRGTDVSADAELLGQLQNLGLLKDVEEIVKEMSHKSYRPSFTLEGLSFNGRYFDHPASALRSIIPRKTSFAKEACIFFSGGASKATRK